MNEMPNLPEVACGCWEPEHPYDVGCICGDSERVLRAVQRDEIKLTPEQREWCLNEVSRVEGYDRADHVNDFDRTLAGAVLSAWTDYCRDKGMI